MCPLSMYLHVHAGEPLLCRSSINPLEARQSSMINVGGWPCEIKYDNVKKMDTALDFGHVATFLPAGGRQCLLFSPFYDQQS